VARADVPGVPDRPDRRPGVFQAIELGKPNAWSNPAVVKALGDIQQLARAGAFQSGYD
jgi:raffinose/stachyose/melibiose transport system substrate-binding protein